MFDDKVIVKFADGELLKGFSQLFFPTEKSIELMSLDNRIHFVDFGKVFAIFFVRDFDGNPKRDRTRPTAILRSYSYGKPVEVELTNGEKIAGKTVGERGPADFGLFLHPMDPNDNNLNIFIPWTSVKKVEPITDPEDSGARRHPHPALR